MEKKEIYALLLLASMIISCKKFLDKKPEKELAVPANLADFEALLNNISVTDVAPGVLDLGTDDYYLDSIVFKSLGPVQRNCYIWNSDIWEGSSADDWSKPYANIYISNVILEGIDEVQINSSSEEIKRNNIRGSALFLRALSHLYLEETFGKPYNPSSANIDLGIPIKLTANTEELSTSRHSVEKVYQQIVKDLVQAVSLLPEVTELKSIPSKAAAYGVLAEVYLNMQLYNKAGDYADSSLQIYHELFDYNMVPEAIAQSANPFIQFVSPNDFPEVLYPSVAISYSILNRPNTCIDSTLIDSYEDSDLRKKLFFAIEPTSNTYYFKGSYGGISARIFRGPAVDEMFLIRAESHARAGSTDLAMQDLNQLLEKRYKTGTFTPLVASDAEEALNIILEERRKELIFRGFRWSDLRRLNQEERFAKTLIRKLNNQTFVLLPNDNRYTYPIPEVEIRLTGIKQNER